MGQVHQSAYLRLGVNIDHVATIRNARGGQHPDPVRAAHLAIEAGADGITAHLREDRRHISDDDIARLMSEIDAPLNLEMAATSEMLKIALDHKPNAACIVPEKREERTTEGGLDAVGGFEHLKQYVEDMSAAGIRVSLFVEPDRKQLDAAKELGTPVVELHTGTYCEKWLSGDVDAFANEKTRIADAADYAHSIGLEVHAGHGITFDTVAPLAEMSPIKELNIGHFLIGEAVFGGLHSAIIRMRSLMDKARSKTNRSISA